MTNTTQDALQLAELAIILSLRYFPPTVDGEAAEETAKEALASIREEIAKKQEPVGYTDESGMAYAIKWSGKLPPYLTLYAAPVRQDPVSYCGASVWLGDRKVTFVASKDTCKHDREFGTTLFNLTQQCLAKLSDELRENKN